MTDYKYISSTDYIDNLAFDYLETYSLQRGVAFEEKSKTLLAEHDKLRARKERGNNLTADAEQRYEKLNRLFGAVQYVLNADGQFHYSSVKTNTFNLDSPKVQLLKDILRTEIIVIPSWMCAPVYRDAIVFYDADANIVSTLNVCLSCEHMAVEPFLHLDADERTYQFLKQFFTSIGHAVDADEY